MKFRLAAGAVLALAGGVQAEDTGVKTFTDLAACYGETLDVALMQKVADGTETEVAVFALPYPNSWEITPNGADKTLKELPCLPEPIETGFFRGAFIEPRLGLATDLFAPPEGTQMWLLRVSTDGSEADPEFSDPYERRKAQQILDSDPEEINGFLHVLWQNDPPYGGGWIYPDDYRSPTGARIVAHCWDAFWDNWQCELEYRIEPRLRISYQFHSDDHDRIPPFIAVDQIVRHQIQSFRKD